MTKPKLIIAALIAAISLRGCGTPAAQPDLGREQAVEIARDHAAREIPGTNLASAPAVRDGGASWIVSFNPPAGFAGGTTRIEIDKRTRAVVNVRAEQ